MLANDDKTLNKGGLRRKQVGMDLAYWHIAIDQLLSEDSAVHDADFAEVLNKQRYI